MRNEYGGLVTALVTPFTHKGAIDYDTLASLIDEQLGWGVNGFVPCGSTGESATLSHAEQAEVIRFVVEQVAGRAKVIAGTGSNATSEAIELTRAAEEAGADAALLITPYYNKPTQEGLIQHFTQIADNSGLPVLLYDIPGRTAVKIELPTLQTLADHPRIIGLKDACGSVANTAEVRAALGEEFLILSGDDALTLAMMSVGADGVISVASHLVARAMRRVITLFTEGKMSEARQANARLLPLFDALFVESNPTPIKLALWITGRLPSPDPRLPLVRPTTESEEFLRTILAAQGLS